MNALNFASCDRQVLQLLGIYIKSQTCKVCAGLQLCSCVVSGNLFAARLAAPMQIEVQQLMSPARCMIT